MIPLQPRQPPSVGAEHRIGDEVGAGHEHFAGRQRGRAERHRDDGRGRLRVALGVVLAHAQQSLAASVDPALRVEIARQRERRGRGPGGEGVQLLVGEVRGVDRALVDGVGGAAVLVHAAADVEPGRRHVCRGAPRRRAHEHVAPAFRRPALQPVEVVAVNGDLSETQGAGRGPRGRERRGPGAVGRLGHRPTVGRCRTVAARRHSALPGTPPRWSRTSCRDLTRGRDQGRGVRMGARASARGRQGRTPAHRCHRL